MPLVFALAAAVWFTLAGDVVTPPAPQAAADAQVLQNLFGPDEEVIVEPEPVAQIEAAVETAAGDDAAEPAAIGEVELVGTPDADVPADAPAPVFKDLEIFRESAE